MIRDAVFAYDATGIKEIFKAILDEAENTESSTMKKKRSLG
jgi:hypothetical protein